MRIAIDARAYSWAGIGRYIQNILTGLAEQPKHTFIVLLGAKDAKNYNGPHEVEIVDDSYYSWREQTLFLQQLNRVKADLWHFPHFNVPILFRQPYVVTIHDTTRFIFPGQNSQSWRQQVAYEYVFAKAVERAQAVITVSNSTREELLSLPISVPTTVRTIYEGVDELFWLKITESSKQKARMLIGTQQPYFLYVGVWMSHKNLARLLEAFSQIARRHPDVRLVMTGKPRPGYSRVLQYAKALRINDRVIFLGFVATHLLPAIYTQAQALVMPSLYEGFGFPALEAAACGVPVITSNVSSLPEIMGRAALYINPEYVPSIVAAMESLLKNQDIRIKLARSGRIRALGFTWSKAVQDHLAIYAQVGTPTVSSNLV